MLEPRLNLAKLWTEDGNFAQAEAVLQESLRIDPKEERVLLEALRLSWSRQEKAQAMEIGKRLLASAKSPWVLTQAGSLMAERHFLEFASSFFEKALSEDPDCADAYLEIGKLLGNRDQFNRAVTVWQEGVRRNPRDPRFVPLIRQALELKRQAEAASRN